MSRSNARYRGDEDLQGRRAAGRREPQGKHRPNVHADEHGTRGYRAGVNSVGASRLPLTRDVPSLRSYLVDVMIPSLT